MSTKYEQYAIIDSQIEILEAQKAGLRDEIIKEMVEKGEKKATTEVGSFTVVPLKTWTYSAETSMFEEDTKKAIKELSEEIKAKKAAEEESGDATYVEKPSLRFTPIKL